MTTPRRELYNELPDPDPFISMSQSALIKVYELHGALSRENGTISQSVLTAKNLFSGVPQ
jgi:hypothetical protein